MKRGQNSVCVIMPAYNEEATVGDVVQKVRENAPFVDIVVIDDGSRDATSVAARAVGAHVIELPFNVGIGSAVQTGLKFAAREGYEFAMQVDGDGQHDPRFIPDLLAVLREGAADMVIGSRFLESVGYRASVMRLFGIRLFAYLIGLVTNRRIFDSTSGYRAYNRTALEFAAEYYPTDFPEPESIVTMLRNGFRIREVSVTMQQRQGGQSSLGKDIGLRSAYFLLSNAIAIVISGFKAPIRS